MSPRLRLPIRTERLVLRDLVPSDLEALYACTSDPDVTRFMYYAPMSLTQTEEYLAEMIAAQLLWPRRAWELAIVRARDGVFLGACDLMRHPHVGAQDSGAADLGYLLARFAWGYGYATEAARAVVRQGFETLGLERIDALCHSGHLASAHVLEKAGLLHERLLRSHKIVKGEPWDMLLYSRTRDSWRAAQHAGEP
jgi:RimJ/RimL family protein N-acetyltransferase